MEIFVQPVRGYQEKIGGCKKRCTFLTENREGPSDFGNPRGGEHKDEGRSHPKDSRKS